jgi:hypothetical protein
MFNSHFSTCPILLSNHFDRVVMRVNYNKFILYFLSHYILVYINSSFDYNRRYQYHYNETDFPNFGKVFSEKTVLDTELYGPQRGYGNLHYLSDI